MNVVGKKVLIVINNMGIGGAERLVVDDINEMVRRAVDVKLITLRREYQKSFVPELNLREDARQCVPFRHFFDIRSWFMLLRSIKVFKPDLLITHLWYANTIGRLAGIMAHTKRIISFEQVLSDTIRSKKSYAVDWILQFKTKKVIAVSDAVRDSLVRHGIKPKRIDVLYNSIDLKVYSASYDRSVVRKEYGIPDNAFLYVYIGRLLVHQKAVDVLIEAFRDVADNNTYLLIVGKGKDRKMLERKVREYGLEERVIFTGVRSDIPRVFASSDCFVLPSHYEGLPLVLTEALAAGAVVIATDFEGAREIITHEENGLVVQKNDPKALTDAMMRIKNDRTLRLRLAGAAKDSAERFSISRHVDALMRYTK